MFGGILGGVDIREVFAIIVLVISVLSWLVNLIQGNSPNAAGQRPPRPKARPQSRNELEELIQELTSDRRKQEKRGEAPAAAKPRSERARPVPTTVPQRPGAPPPYTPSRQQTQQKQTQQIAEAKKAEAKKAISKRVVSDLGEGIRSHHVASRIETPLQPANALAAATTIDHRISSSTPTQEKPIHPLVKLLREPGGMRQALLLNEILERPKSLRH